MKKITSLSVLVFALVLGSGASFALAEGGDSTATPSPSSTENPKAIRGCAVITKGVETRIKNFDSRKGSHYEQYAKIKTRLDAFITKAKAAGHDTTTLEAHLVVLNTKIQKFVTNYAAYQAALKDTKTATCGKSEGEFKTKIESARTEQMLKIFTPTSKIRSPLISRHSSR
jgi:hypothetical protein